MVTIRADISGSIRTKAYGTISRPEESRSRQIFSKYLDLTRTASCHKSGNDLAETFIAVWISEFAKKAGRLCKQAGFMGSLRRSVMEVVEKCDTANRNPPS